MTHVDTLQPDGPPPGYGYCTTARAWLTCLRCSAVICDAELHDKFHEYVEQS